VQAFELSWQSSRIERGDTEFVDFIQAGQVVHTLEKSLDR
jgi:hypothetical protein